jgi:serine/threonine protein kinase
MGTVYEAFDERLERPVAVKVIRADHFHDLATRARFRREATIAARIDHPAVVAVYDSGELEDGALYIVMEWLDGSDLADALRRCGPGTPAEVATLVRQIGHGLAAAHDAGLLHRDIKPDNVFLVRRPEGFAAKLLDFGVAKVVGHSSGLTRADAVVGTPRFMSPEQLQQRPLDARSDLYSLAAVVYQALTGRRVTLAEEFAEVVFDVVNTMPPPVSALLPATPHEVDDAMLAALAKHPEDRPASLEAWAEELAAALGQMTPCRAGWLTPDGTLDVEREEQDHKTERRETTRVDR